MLFEKWQLPQIINILDHFISVTSLSLDMIQLRVARRKASALYIQSCPVLHLQGSLAHTDEEDVYQKINKIFKCVSRQWGQCSGNRWKTNK